MKSAHKFGVGQALKATFEHLYSTLKIWRENVKFRWHFADHRQSEARNFKTTQHIDKQKYIFI